MQGFGMQGVSGFAPPPPQMEQPSSDGGGKGGLGIAQGVLDLVSMIPGPQQPFVAGASALGHVAKGAMTKNPMEALGGLTSAVGAGSGIGKAFGLGAGTGAGQAVQGAQSFMPQAQEAMAGGAQAGSFMPQAQNALAGGASQVGSYMPQAQNMGFDAFNPYEFLNPPSLFNRY